MRKAFSMIELIFIMIVLGVLASTLQMNMPDNKIFNDINFITQKIKAKQLYALSYDNYDYEKHTFLDEKTCIVIDKDSFNAIEKKETKTNPYKIKSKITNPPDNNVCFDSLGRPHLLNDFTKMPIVFTITYKNRTKTINILPFSGTIVRE